MKALIECLVESSSEESIIFRNGTKCVGNFDDTGLNGKCSIEFPNHVTLKGNFKSGRIDGNGELVFADGGVYKGEVNTDGVPHGEGEYMLESNIYRGQWVEGKRCGHGVFESPDFIYEGEWVNDQMCGEGEIKYSNGVTYKGGMKEDLFHGEGIFEAAENKCYIYEGEWQAGKPNGFGKWVSGEDAYFGNFKEGLRHGKGTYLYGNGSRYHGGWLKDKKHGEATIITQNGQHAALEFENDAPTTQFLPESTLFPPLEKLYSDIEYPSLQLIVERDQKLIRKLINRYERTLRKLYASVETFQLKHLWSLFPQISKCMLNRAAHEARYYLETLPMIHIHDLEIPLLLREFTEAIVRVAHKLGSKEAEICNFDDPCTIRPLQQTAKQLKSLLESLPKDAITYVSDKCDLNVGVLFDQLKEQHGNQKNVKDDTVNCASLLQHFRKHNITINCEPLSEWRKLKRSECNEFDFSSMCQKILNASDVGDDTSFLFDGSKPEIQDTYETQEDGSKIIRIPEELEMENEELYDQLGKLIENDCVARISALPFENVNIVEGAEIYTIDGVYVKDYPEKQILELLPESTNVIIKRIPAREAETESEWLDEDGFVRGIKIKLNEEIVLDGLETTGGVMTSVSDSLRALGLTEGMRIIYLDDDNMEDLNLQILKAKIIENPEATLYVEGFEAPEGFASWIEDCELEDHVIRKCSKSSIGHVLGLKVGMKLQNMRFEEMSAANIRDIVFLVSAAPLIEENEEVEEILDEKTEDVEEVEKIDLDGGVDSHSQRMEEKYFQWLLENIGSEYLKTHSDTKGLVEFINQSEFNEILV